MLARIESRVAEMNDEIVGHGSAFSLGSFSMKMLLHEVVEANEAGFQRGRVSFRASSATDAPVDPLVLVTNMRMLLRILVRSLPLTRA